MPVLREELADRDFPLLRGHRLRGGPTRRLGGRVYWTHVSTGIDHTGRMSSLEAGTTCPFKRAQTCATRRRPEQTAPARLRTLRLMPPHPLPVFEHQGGKAKRLLLWRLVLSVLVLAFTAAIPTRALAQDAGARRARDAGAAVPVAKEGGTSTAPEASDGGVPSGDAGTPGPRAPAQQRAGPPPPNLSPTQAALRRHQPLA